MFICLCKGLREVDVRSAARAGCTSPEALIAQLRLDADDCCGRCLREIDLLVDLAVGEAARFAPRGAASAARCVQSTVIVS